MGGDIYVEYDIGGHYGGITGGAVHSIEGGIVEPWSQFSAMCDLRSWPPHHAPSRMVSEVVRRI